MIASSSSTLAGGAGQGRSAQHPPTGLDRNEVGAMIVAAGLAGARDHALISLLALNGLRVSEAIGADIEQLSLERGHRTLLIHRKGGKTVTVPVAPRTARAVDLVIGERCAGPIFCDRTGGVDTEGSGVRVGEGLRVRRTRRSPPQPQGEVPHLLEEDHGDSRYYFWTRPGGCATISTATMVTAIWRDRCCRR